MEEHNGDEVDGVRRREAGPRGVAALEVPGGPSRVDSAGPVRLPETSLERNLRSVIERIDSLDLRLGGEVARCRETVEIRGLHLFGKAIDALSNLEADWVRAHAEADSLRMRLREATSAVGELQQQLDRIADLRRKAEAEAARHRDELQRELAQARQQLARALDAQRVANEQREAAERECLQLQRRISWRVMAPLRFVRSLFPKSH
jgi:chromosome segregation ATPase